MKLRTVAVAIVLATAFPAHCQDHRPDDEVVILRNQLRQVRGVVIQVGGINTIEALRVLADAVIDIEARLGRIERR